MNWRRPGLAFVSATVGLALLASAASGAPSAKKQRVVILAQLVLATNKEKFTLTPLSPGPLKKDSGTGVGSGVLKPAIIENGQEVVVIIGKDILTGKRGNFVLTQVVRSVKAGRPGETADTGTWKFIGKTGAYKGVSGGGGFAAVCCARTGVLYGRMEGMLTIP